MEAEFALSALEEPPRRLTSIVPGAGRRNRRENQAESIVSHVRSRSILVVVYAQAADRTSHTNTRGTDSVIAAL